MAGDDVFQLDQDQIKALYHFLDIDHWKKTDTKKEADNDEWSMFYSNQDGQFIMKHYAADTSYQISISNSTETMTYQIDHKIGSIHEFLKQDMQSWYGFDDTHPIISNLKEVSIQKEKNLLYEYSISKSDLMSHEAVLIEDTTYQRYYLIVSSQTMDYQHIADQGNILAVSGSRCHYAVPYVHVFQLTEEEVLKKITINNKPIEVFALLHLSYPAKTS